MIFLLHAFELNLVCIFQKIVSPFGIILKGKVERSRMQNVIFHVISISISYIIIFLFPPVHKIIYLIYVGGFLSVRYTLCGN